MHISSERKRKKNAKQITVDFGSKCWLNVLQYALIGKMCCFWRNVLFLEKCAVLEKCFGKKNILPKQRNVHINAFDAYSKC